MAVSKIWPLYQTIGKAVKYICNYEKTEDGTLIYSYKCTEKFADHEFRDIAAKARKIKKPRIGYHATISFSPEDNIEPQKALEIGRDIMDKYTGGQYQYVMSVHTDQKHIHVHCILNSVSFIDCKKLHIKDKDLDKLERLTDKACIENGLSVIENKSGVKGRGKYEYDKHNNGESWKDKLREAIDKEILESTSYEEFLERMQMEEGYEIKQGKYLSFRAENQERYTRTKRLGDFYSIDSIVDRIENKQKYISNEQGISAETKFQSDEKIEEDKFPSPGDDMDLNVRLDNRNIKKLIDVEKNEKAKSISAYRKKLNLVNIDTYAGMIEFVNKYHLVYKEDFDAIDTKLKKKNDILTTEIRKLYGEVNTLEADIKQYQKFLTSRKAHQEYVATHDKDKKYELREFYKQYESALVYFKHNDISLADVNVKNLQSKLNRMEKINARIDELKRERSGVKSDIKKLEIIRQNNEKVFGNELFQKTPQQKKRSEKENQLES